MPSRNELKLARRTIERTDCAVADVSAVAVARDGGEA